jgi:hypothetical protein
MGPNMSGWEPMIWETAVGEDVRIMTGRVAPARKSADYLGRNCCGGGAVRLLARHTPKEDVMNASSDRLLRRTLWGNAAFSVVSGAGLSIFAGPLARAAAHSPVEVAGLDLPLILELLGLGVIAFGALCAWVASRPTLPQGLARLIFAADLAWVAGSVLVLALPAAWTTAGIAGIVVVALIVADLAILEYLGLRRLGTAT